MKKLFSLLFIVGCGSVVTPTPEPVIELPEPIVELPRCSKVSGGACEFFTDLYVYAITHEIGHSLGLIHPFESPTYGAECRAKLQSYSEKPLVYPFKDIMEKDYPKAIQYWDYSEDFPYDRYSIMQYDVCRIGYVYEPRISKQDVIFVNTLYEIHVNRAIFSLWMPYTKETAPFFRTKGDVPVCLFKNEPEKNINLLKEAVHAWSMVDFNIYYKGVCEAEDFADDHTIRIAFITGEGQAVGNSYVGVSSQMITMQIFMHPQPELFITQDKYSLINL